LTIGFIAVAMAAGNAVGGYVATVRMLDMFQHARPAKKAGTAGAQ
jgi:NAD(P) transhydrogenase subunit alpha